MPRLGQTAKSDAAFLADLCATLKQSVSISDDDMERIRTILERLDEYDRLEAAAGEFLRKALCKERQP
jgi:hypothetical protein